ncbi:MAG TPA: zinc-ribbon domain-containing protein [Candidatus Binataceae bacterium]|nr:zinc-ribbon domain-containing protein [Candidatus Binataceae bacterium]
MIDVQCPSCATRYRIDEAILPADRPSFKCSRCGQVFGVNGAAERGSPLKTAAACLAAIVLCAAALVWTMQLWRADPFIPIAGDFNLMIAGHDLYAELLAVKSLCDSGWIFTNSYLGAPFTMQAYDAPNLDMLDTAAMKLVTLLTCDAPLVLNIYFLLTFPLTVLTSLLVLRQFGVSYASAIVASLLFAFLPYHLLRGEAHILLASYWTIPLAVMLMLWVWMDDGATEPDEEPWGWSGAKWAVALACAAVAGLAHAYYGCFAVFLLIAAGIGGAVRAGKAWNLWLAMILSGAIVFGIAASTAPSIAYSWNNGANSIAASRTPQEGEFLGLKISRLILPVTGHRIAALADLKDFYNSTTPGPVPQWLAGVLGKTSRPVVNETDTQTLGAVASMGFLFLLASLLWLEKVGEPLNCLAILSISALLVGTAGGLGTVFNYLITAQIRGYNRLSIYIAFFSLFAVAILFDDIAAALVRAAGRLSGAAIWYPVLALILAGGILDQTTPKFIPDYAKTKAEFLSDAGFVNQVEASLPQGAMILQLPYLPFPENGAVHKMWGWDPLKGYIHSKGLKWSYGVMTGRPEATWAGKFQGRPMEEVLPTLAFAGFEGIYIDRYGFKDDAAALEKTLSGLLDEYPVVSTDGRLSFFSLEKFDDALRAKYTPIEWERQHKAALVLPMPSANQPES